MLPNIELVNRTLQLFRATQDDWKKSCSHPQLTQSSVPFAQLMGERFETGGRWFVQPIEKLCDSSRHSVCIVLGEGGVVMILDAFSILWLAGGCAALGLAIYRKFVSRWEDDNMHVREYDAPRVARQAGIAAMLDSVDKWGITLTITVIVYGALLVGAYVYQQWIVSTQLVP